MNNAYRIMKTFEKYLKENNDPLSVMADKRPMTHEELIRALRFSISSEYEAIRQYKIIMESTDNEDVQKVMQSVSDEERVHVGEFMDVLFKLDPKEKELYEKGQEEVQTMEKS